MRSINLVAAIILSLATWKAVDLILLAICTDWKSFLKDFFG